MQRYRSLVFDKPGHPAYTPLQAILRGKQTNKKTLQYNTRMLLHHKRVWEIALKKQSIGRVYSHTPLWLNSHMPELELIPDSTIWALHGIIFLHQILSSFGLKPFQTLKEEYKLPNHLTFKYLQLRHAIRSQLPNMEIEMEPPLVLNIVIGEEPSELILNFYSTLRLKRTIAITQKAKIAWEQEVGPIDDADWYEILKGVETVSPKLSDRLTQLYIIHKAYLTPLRMTKIQRTFNPLCPGCLAVPGIFYHLIWSCPNIQTYWTQVIRFLHHDTMGSPVVLDPKLCLLVLLPDVEIDKYQTVFIYETLFLARKVVARLWMQAAPPTTLIWKKDVIDTLSYR